MTIWGRVEMVKVIFSDEENRDFNGTCQHRDRNHSSKIIIYKDSPDKLKTLIHELIHNFLFEKSEQGYKSRILDKINDDEIFVDGLAVDIASAIRENKDKVIK